MSKNNDYQQFFPNQKLDSKQLVVDVPTSPRYPYQERIPNGYDPMGDIYLRGRAYRGLAGGRSPWWVLISGWSMYGSIALLMMILAINSPFLALLAVSVVFSFPLVFLSKGTSIKLSSKKCRHPKR